MVELTFTVDDLIKKEDDMLNTKIDRHETDLAKAKEELLNGDKAEFDYWLNEYNYQLDKIEEYKNLRHDYKGRYEKLRADYDVFRRMANELNSEFKAVVDGDKIRFKWFGSTLNFIVEALASRYKLHCGMFTFKSSFTTHEAYTENDHLVHIGVDRDDPKAQIVLIDFHLL